MGFVFISYSRQDSQVVDIIVSRLKSDGFDVWIDRVSIKGGDFWTVAIVEAIDTAESFVLMLSPSSTASDNVRKEVQLAQDAKRKLFPLLLTAIKLPPQFRYQLAGIQLIDFAADLEAKYRELAEVLQASRDSVAKEEQPKTRQVETVISSGNFATFDTAERERLLLALAAIAETAHTNLVLTNATPGSIHAFIEMPTHAAYVLKAAALNRDKRLLKQKIDALRLDGEENYVDTHSGEIGPLNLPKRGYPLPMLILSFLTGALATAGLISTLMGGISIPRTPTVTLTLPLTVTATNSPISPTITPSSTATHTSTPTPTLTLTPTPSPTFSFTPATRLNNPKSDTSVITPVDITKPISKPSDITPTESCTLVPEVYYEYDPVTKEYYKYIKWVCK